MLGVRRRGEQPTDLLRAQNNGQAARLAGRHDLFGKIMTLQRDLEEEPQGTGPDVDGCYRRSDRAQRHNGCARPCRERRASPPRGRRRRPASAIAAERRGQPMGDNDLLIAAHALAAQLTLVTDDRGFARIPELLRENWLAG